ncbi:hypothetical protein COY23_03475 [bacterium (Candidatus Torokbacteria) CG_4_10_14_0_2_um_filter_35_8]|nr:MAG: hypothetical protein COY23_03475 [bacterium (Candidatus Torokbacteria) CG_4_10_14_0_2_um_filter_35_8]
MNPGLARYLDKYIGTPLCFLLTIIDSFIKIFKREKKIKSPKKVLFIELSEMGSAILSYSAIKKLQQKFPKAKTYFLIFKKNKESVEILDIISKERVLTIRSDSIFSLLKDTMRVIFKIRKLKLDAVLDLELFSRFTAILSYLSGAKTKVGYYKFHTEGLYRGNLINRKVIYNSYLHMSKNFIALVDSIHNDSDYPLLKKSVPDNEIKRKVIKSSRKDKEIIFKKLKSMNPNITKKNKIILINPNASKFLPIRKWPIENYCRLIKLVLKQKHTITIVIGAQSDKYSAKKICDYIKNNKRCINFAGKTKSIKELVDLYNISDLLITNDSGPAHFASMANVHQVVFFGPETPKLYAPLGENTTIMYSNFACSPCVSAFNYKKTSCRDNKCLRSIKVSDVYDVVRKKII